MLASISPLGERARSSRWGVTVTAYVIGSVLGGAALGLLAAALGRCCRRRGGAPRPPASSSRRCCWPGCSWTRRVAGLRLPTWRRQVDEAWLGALPRLGLRRRASACSSAWASSPS